MLPIANWVKSFPVVVKSIILLTAFAFLEANALTLERLKVPDGFNLSIYASGVPNARQMTRGATGNIYVGSRRAGAVYAVIDKDGDFEADAVHTIAEGLYMPSGVAFRDGVLYVAEVNRIIAFDDIDTRYAETIKPRVVYDKLPDDAHHGWKFIAFGPDGKLYIPVGAPCNVCEVDAPYASILRLDVETKEIEIVAEGIRNSVGFDWQPDSNELWFTDNGRDMMGDDVPPGEINRIDREKQHFGFPYIHAGDILDPQFGDGKSADAYVAPALKLGAHVAPLGAYFYRGKLFPNSYQGQLFVAEHGSWNRSRKSGYRVMLASIGLDNKVTDYQPVINGWLLGQAHWGRPVDFEMLDDGSLLISDDYAGVIYRLNYKAAK